MKFTNYETGGFFDEMFTPEGVPRHGYAALKTRIESLPTGEIEARQAAAEQAFYDLGITFTVYGHTEGTEKIFPLTSSPASSSAPSGRVWSAALNSVSMPSISLSMTSTMSRKSSKTGLFQAS